MEELKAAVISAPVLKAPEYNLEDRPFVLRTDACETGAGSVLEQEDINGNRRPCRFDSKWFSDGEMKYSIPKKELYAVVFGLKKNRVHLYGQQFILEVDAQCLIGMLNKPDLPDAAMTHWLAWAKLFVFEV